MSSPGRYVSDFSAGPRRMLPPRQFGLQSSRPCLSSCNSQSPSPPVQETLGSVCGRRTLSRDKKKKEREGYRVGSKLKQVAPGGCVSWSSFPTFLPPGTGQWRPDSNPLKPEGTLSKGPEHLPYKTHGGAGGMGGDRDGAQELLDPGTSCIGSPLGVPRAAPCMSPLSSPGRRPSSASHPWANELCPRAGVILGVSQVPPKGRAGSGREGGEQQPTSPRRLRARPSARCCTSPSFRLSDRPCRWTLVMSSLSWRVSRLTSSPQVLLSEYRGFLVAPRYPPHTLGGSDPVHAGEGCSSA